MGGGLVQNLRLTRGSLSGQHWSFVKFVQIICLYFLNEPEQVCPLLSAAPGVTMFKKARRDTWRGAAAGAVAGLAATFVMTQVQKVAGRFSSSRAAAEHPQHSTWRGEPGSARQQSGDDATVRAASAVWHRVTGHSPSQRVKEIGGPLLHYGMGAAAGAFYGATAGRTRIPRWAGLPFGAAVFVAADVIAVPLLGLAEPPRRHPVQVYGRALVAHLAFGLATEALTPLVRRGLDRLAS